MGREQEKRKERGVEDGTGMVESSTRTRFISLHVCDKRFSKFIIVHRITDAQGSLTSGGALKHCQAKARILLSFSLRLVDMVTVLKELDDDQNHF